ncbi:uncharacterized protein LOC135482098 [Liolophura sinensis]|uniref:uncharacterized protein LOC135482098 n=1 Tax=Liolophura sinensis TaxID=3198878 RepID=UPI003158E746
MVAKLFQTTIPVNDPPTSPRNDSDRKKCNLIHDVNEIRARNRRLPTPEKAAILELSDSFEKRRLGKHQQMLHDISQRCREQEVADLSKNLSIKCQQKQQKPLRNNISFYNTASMTPRMSSSTKPKAVTNQIDIQNHMSIRPSYDKATSHFPARKIIKNQKKNEVSSTMSSASLKFNKCKSDSSISAFFRARTEKFLNVDKVNNYLNVKTDYLNKRNNFATNHKQPRMFDNPEEMENYYFPRKRQIDEKSFLPQIPLEQNSYQEKVCAYLDGLRHHKERSTSGKSGNSYYRIKSDSGIYMMNGPRDRHFSPMDPISTRIGSSTLVTNRDKYTVTQTSVTSFL